MNKALASTLESNPKARQLLYMLLIALLTGPSAGAILWNVLQASLCDPVGVTDTSTVPVASTAAPTWTPQPTRTPVPTWTPTPVPTWTPEPEDEPSATPTPTDTATASPSPTAVRVEPTDEPPTEVPAAVPSQTPTAEGMEGVRDRPTATDTVTTTPVIECREYPSDPSRAWVVRCRDTVKDDPAANQCSDVIGEYNRYQGTNVGPWVRDNGREDADGIYCSSGHFVDLIDQYERVCPAAVLTVIAEDNAVVTPEPEWRVSCDTIQP